MYILIRISKLLLLLVVVTSQLSSKEETKDIGEYKIKYTVTDDSLISSLIVIRDKIVVFSYEGEIAGKSTMKIFFSPEFGFPATVNFLENNEFLSFSYIRDNSTERIIWNKSTQKFNLDINAALRDPFAPEKK